MTLKTDFKYKPSIMKLKENFQIQIPSSGKAWRLKAIDPYQLVSAYEFIDKEFEGLPHFLCLGQRTSPCLCAAGEALAAARRAPCLYRVCLSQVSILRFS